MHQSTENTSPEHTDNVMIMYLCSILRIPRPGHSSLGHVSHLLVSSLALFLRPLDFPTDGLRHFLRIGLPS